MDQGLEATHRSNEGQDDNRDGPLVSLAGAAIHLLKFIDFMSFLNLSTNKFNTKFFSNYQKLFRIPFYLKEKSNKTELFSRFSARFLDVRHLDLTNASQDDVSLLLESEYNQKIITLKINGNITPGDLSGLTKQYVNLKRVTLISSQHIDNRCLANLSGTCTDLTALTLTGCANVKSGFQRLIEDDFAKLTELTVQQESLNAKFFAKIKWVLSERLVKLDLSRCNGFYETNIIDVFNNFTKLTSLSLQQSQMVKSSSDLAYKSKYSDINLTKLDLDGARFSQEMLSYIVGSNLGKLTKLNLSNLDILISMRLLLLLSKHTKGLTDLELMGSEFDLDGEPVEGINWPDLKYLDLSLTKNVSNDVVSYLVAGSPSLLTLSLRQCKGLSHDLLSRLAGFHQGLVEIDLGYQDKAEKVQIFIDNKTSFEHGLKVLNLDNNPDVGRILQELLKNRQYKNLKALSLRGFNDLTDEMLHHVFAFWSELNSIHLSGCHNITQHVFNNLSTHESLKSLELSSNYFHEGWLAHILDCFPKLQSLRIMEALSPNKKEENDVFMPILVLDFMQQNQPKHDINLTEDSFDDLLSHDQLCSLDLSFCKKISPMIIPKLILAFPNLLSLKLPVYEEFLGLFHTDAQSIQDQSIIIESSDSCWSKVKFLDFTHDAISNQQVIKIIECCPNLESFRLELSLKTSSNDSIISPNAVNYFDDCSLGNQMILSVVQHCRYLKYLDLSGNGYLDDNTLQAIAHKAPQLKSLVVKNCHKITDLAFLNQPPNSWPNLQELDLSGCSQLTSKVNLLLIMNCPSLEKLTLADSMQEHWFYWNNEDTNLCWLQINNLRLIDDPSLNDLSVQAILKRCCHIVSLEIINCPNIGMDAFANLNKDSLSNLRTVKLNDIPQLENKSICDLSEVCHNITHLTITNNNKISDESLAKFAAECLELQSIRLKNCPSIEGGFILSVREFNSKIEELSIESCGLKKPSVNFTEIDAKSFGNLTTLNLAYNPYMAESFIEAILSSCTKLQVFNIKGYQPLMKGIVSELSKQKDNLRTINFEDCYKLDNDDLEGLSENCTQVESITLSNCSRIRDGGVMALAKSCRNIKILKLRGCKITKKSVNSITDKLHRLTVLDLAYCNNVSTDSLEEIIYRDSVRNLDLEGCQVLKPALFNRIPENLWPNLKTLNLSIVDEITDDLFAILAKNLSVIESLTIKGQGNGLPTLTGEGLSQLVHPYLLKLLLLDLSYCTEVTDHGLSSIIKYSTELTSLDLCGCDLITDVGVIDVAENCTNLHQLNLEHGYQLDNESVKKLMKKQENLISLNNHTKNKYKWLPACCATIVDSLYRGVQEDTMDSILETKNALFDLNWHKTLMIPSVIRKFSEEIKLTGSIRYKRVSDAAMKALSKLPYLHVLNVNHSPHISSDPFTSGQWSSLKFLYLWGCTKITGACLQNISRNMGLKMIVTPDFKCVSPQEIMEEYPQYSDLEEKAEEFNDDSPNQADFVIIDMPDEESQEGDANKVSTNQEKESFWGFLKRIFSPKKQNNEDALVTTEEDSNPDERADVNQGVDSLGSDELKVGHLDEDTTLTIRSSDLQGIPGRSIRHPTEDCFKDSGLEDIESLVNSKDSSTSSHKSCNLL
ncbi:MAG TPA: hypothetical protein QF353_01275 [Gammaproteobacteria bacterium]|nr:hypothetical protein [Gammaproteobacteria bacterium]